MAGPEQFAPLLVPYLTTIKDELEKSIPYMYVDSQNKVTVGAGHNLTSHKDHKDLKFKIKRHERHQVLGGDVGIPIPKERPIDAPALPTEIQNDFAFLTAHAGSKQGEALSKYVATQSGDPMRKFTTVELDQTEIDGIFWKDMVDAIGTARAAFPKDAFDGYPVTCQAALIDIAFNTGRVNFPNLKKAINGEAPYSGKPESERWEIAASESNRPAADEKRNKQIAAWFRGGVTEAKAKEEKAKAGAAP